MHIDRERITYTQDMTITDISAGYAPGRHKKGTYSHEMSDQIKSKRYQSQIKKKHVMPLPHRKGIL